MLSIFKTAELENRYLSLYGTVLDMWPAAHQPIDASTGFGTTHLNTAGPSDGFAMLLLPGYGANSTMWYPNVPALSSQFRLLAVDVPGQPGRDHPVYIAETSDPINTRILPFCQV